MKIGARNKHRLAIPTATGLALAVFLAVPIAAGEDVACTDGSTANCSSAGQSAPKVSSAHDASNAKRLDRARSASSAHDAANASRFRPSPVATSAHDAANASRYPGGQHPYGPFYHQTRR